MERMKKGTALGEVLDAISQSVLGDFSLEAEAAALALSWIGIARLVSRWSVPDVHRPLLRFLASASGGLPVQAKGAMVT